MNVGAAGLLRAGTPIFPTDAPRRREISSILAARRDALSQAEGEATQRFSGGGQGEDKQQHLLQRIRGYFGL